MSERIPDEALAQHLRRAGILTAEQIASALRAQAERAARGESSSLREILVHQGLLSAELIENIERTLEGRREEARRLGPYRILKKLGEGGMGAVYLAEDAAGAKVALKVLPKSSGQDEDALRRFRREVENARALEHPHIVRAWGAGEDRGFHYYAMEYVEGETLKARLKREGVLAPEEATRFVLQVARGLQYAHAKGFIHRDIKPDNIIVTQNGVAKILDMGLSKNIEESQTFRTVTGVALGTPHYIAPEQARGEKTIDGRADLYSLGATYYHLLAGEPPFQGATALEVISQHLNKQIPDPRDIRDGIPDGAVHVLRNMMAKRPEDRYRDAGELIEDLERILEGRPPASRALEAARSAVALPLAREARERLRAERRLRRVQDPARPRPGTFRTVAPRRPKPMPVLLGGTGAVAAVLLALVAALNGKSSLPPAELPTRPSPPETPLPPQALAPPAQGLPTLQESRAQEARRKLDEIRALEKDSRLGRDEVLRRYAEFARDYADTPHGQTITDWLAVLQAEKAGARRILSPEGAPLPAPPPVESQPEPSLPVAPPSDPQPTGPPPLDPAAKPPPPAPRRSPVPDSTRRREAEAAVRKAFPFDQAGTPKEKGDLARTLLEAATRSGAQGAELYALLALARNLATQAMDARTALAAAEALSAAFDVDATAVKVEIFSEVRARGPEAAVWATAALEAADEASEADRYEAAVKFSSRAETLARASGDKNLLETARERLRELADLQRLAEGLKAHFKTLETKPDDPAANAAVGKFVSLVKGDWRRGLPMLAKGLDAALKALAEQELANPRDPAAQAALGEAWAAQAEKETPTYRARARARAAEWLERAIPNLSGLARVSAERKLASLGSPRGAPSRSFLDLGGGIRLELVLIKPGTFAMGSNEPGIPEEQPPHTVTLSRAFYLGRYEVTRGQFAAFVRATDYKTEAERAGGAHAFINNSWQRIPGVSWRDPKPFTQTDDHPAVCISWNDATAFCEWASKKTGREVRLPTEAEWEYACRAGTTTRWSCGDSESDLPEYAWYNKNSYMQTHPVGQKKPNPWGLFDMHGNVWEWCRDWMGPYPGASRDPEGPPRGEKRCQRGGTWHNPAHRARTAFRYGSVPFFSSTDFGFRVAVR